MNWFPDPFSAQRSLNLNCSEECPNLQTRSRTGYASSPPTAARSLNRQERELTEQTPATLPYEKGMTEKWEVLDFNVYEFYLKRINPRAGTELRLSLLSSFPLPTKSFLLGRLQSYTPTSYLLCIPGLLHSCLPNSLTSR